MVKSAGRLTEKGINIRPAEVGDICILLEPFREDEITRLRQMQASLQSIFGGTQIDRVHLTCQRFTIRDAQELRNIQSRLSELLGNVEPFPLTALSLQTLYVTFRQTNILKWRIEKTVALRHLTAMLEQTLLGMGIEPLYGTGFVSSLVAALKGVPELEDSRLAEYEGLPQRLFDGEQVVMSKLCGANEFEILAKIPLLSPGESSA